MDTTLVTSIKKDVESVLIYSQNLSVDHLNLDNLFDDWEDNKEKYYEAFGKQLIKEVGPVEVELGYSQKETNMNSFLNKAEILADKFGIRESTFTGFLELIDANGPINFYENKVGLEGWEEYDEKHNRVVKLDGMKLLKAFKFYCDGNKDYLDALQSEASRVLQVSKLTGTLCLSIHPLDYLSSSENNHNWRSCHALDGEYRAGNLSYMADPTTIVCYVKSDAEDSVLPRFPEDVKWNSKKWRMLLFFSEEYNMMMAGRQYPFETNTLLPKVLKAVNEMFDTEFSPWSNYYIPEVKLPFLTIDGETPEGWDVYINGSMYMVTPGPGIARLQDVVSNGPKTMHYNDLLSSSTYTLPYYSVQKYKSWFSGYANVPTGSKNHPKIKVGKACKCVECNDKYIEHSESVLCLRCMLKEGQTDDTDVFGNCYFCDEVFILDEGDTAYSRGQGYYVCPDCINNGTVIKCAYCGNYVINSEINYDGICAECEWERQEEKKSAGFGW